MPAAHITAKNSIQFHLFDKLDAAIVRLGDRISLSNKRSVPGSLRGACIILAGVVNTEGNRLYRL